MLPKIPPLKKDEEYRLLAQRTSAAKTKLIQANLGMVYKLACPFARKYDLDVDDLVQEGIIGLLKAMEKFESKRNLKFITYATPWIQAQLFKYVRKARAGGKTGEQKEKYLKEVSLDAPLSTQEDSSTMLDLLESEINTETIVAEAEEKRNLQKHMEKAKQGLNERERHILTSRWLVLEEDFLTLGNLGKQLNLTKERIRQIEKRAMRKFSKALRSVIS